MGFPVSAGNADAGNAEAGNANAYKNFFYDTVTPVSRRGGRVAVQVDKQLSSSRKGGGLLPGLEIFRKPQKGVGLVAAETSKQYAVLF